MEELKNKGRQKLDHQGLCEPAKGVWVLLQDSEKPIESYGMV